MSRIIYLLTPMSDKSDIPPSLYIERGKAPQVQGGESEKTSVIKYSVSFACFYIFTFLFTKPSDLLQHSDNIVNFLIFNPNYSQI